MAAANRYVKKSEASASKKAKAVRLLRVTRGKPPRTGKR